MRNKILLTYFAIFIIFGIYPTYAEGLNNTWKDQILYFVLTDRFMNGTTENDVATDLNDPYAFHGGDFIGIQKKIKYLKELGITGLWISPVFQNRPDKFFKHFAYHGYWVWDFWQTDPRFGTMGELKALREELKKNNIKCLLDMVVNHMDYNAPFVNQYKDWFHNTPEISDWNNQKELEDHKIFGLPDFASEKPVVKTFFELVQNYWIDQLSPDGFRLDAVKHVPISFWSDLNTKAVVKAGDNFMRLGELLDGNPMKIAKYWKEGNFGTLFDYPLYYTFKSVFAEGASCRLLGGRFYSDKLYKDPGLLATFLDNHDLDRFISSCNGNLQNYRLALATLLTVRGIPTLCYGDESALAGKHEPAPMNRRDMEFDVESEDFKYLASLIKLRKDNIALRQGIQCHLYMDDESYAFARLTPDQIAVVLINNSDQHKTMDFEFPFALPKMVFKDKFSDNKVIYRDSRLHTTLKPKSFAVFIPEVKEGFYQAAFEHWSDRFFHENDWGFKKVVFKLRAEGLPEDGKVFLIGSLPQLGEWNSSGKLHAFTKIDDENFELEIKLPLGAIFECKCLAKTPEGIVWQEGDNFIDQVRESGTEYFHIKWVCKQ